MSKQQQVNESDEATCEIIDNIAEELSNTLALNIEKCRPNLDDNNDWLTVLKATLSLFLSREALMLSQAYMDTKPQDTIARATAIHSEITSMSLSSMVSSFYEDIMEDTSANN